MDEFGSDAGLNRSAICENSFVDHAPPGSATYRGSRADESLNAELQSEVQSSRVTPSIVNPSIARSREASIRNF